MAKEHKIEYPRIPLQAQIRGLGDGTILVILRAHREHAKRLLAILHARLQQGSTRVSAMPGKCSKTWDRPGNKPRWGELNIYFEP